MEIWATTLIDKLISRCYYPKNVHIAFKQLHDFSDASYSGVVYLRMVDTNGEVHTSLVIAKTKVAPIKRISIPRLELCGVKFFAQLLNQCLDFLLEDTLAWTDTKSSRLCLLPSELLTHDLWWNGPSWLQLGIQDTSKWTFHWSRRDLFIHSNRVRATCSCWSIFQLCNTH